jgi:hypothetical protein
MLDILTYVWDTPITGGHVIAAFIGWYSAAALHYIYRTIRLKYLYRRIKKEEEALTRHRIEECGFFCAPKER